MCDPVESHQRELIDSCITYHPPHTLRTASPGNTSVRPSQSVLTESEKVVTSLDTSFPQDHLCINAPLLPEVIMCRFTVSKSLNCGIASSFRGEHVLFYWIHCSREHLYVSPLVFFCIALADDQ